jgi:hypothetical protein
MTKLTLLSAVALLASLPAWANGPQESDDGTDESRPTGSAVYNTDNSKVYAPRDNRVNAPRDNRVNAPSSVRKTPPPTPPPRSLGPPMPPGGPTPTPTQPPLGQATPMRVKQLPWGVHHLHPQHHGPTQDHDPEREQC